VGAKNEGLLPSEMNNGNVLAIPNKEGEMEKSGTFPNGKSTLEFDDFISIIKDSCMDRDQAENYLVYAFSMFDR
jgi:Ca2+-binding EF-hand superfamily protein